VLGLLDLSLERVELLPRRLLLFGLARELLAQVKKLLELAGRALGHLVGVLLLEGVKAAVERALIRRVAVHGGASEALGLLVLD